jgi:tRNA-modifying protein YgfZ
VTGRSTAAVLVGALDPSSVDAPVIAHFGDPLREQRQLATDVGVVDRSHRDVLAVSGADRLTWLHSLTTQHLERLEPMTGTQTLLLSPHGHVEQHAVLHDDGDTTWLDVEPGTGTGLLEFLQRMRFLLRVDPVDASSGWAVLSVVGPQSDRVLRALGVTGLAAPDRLEVPGPKFAGGTLPARATSRTAVVSLPSGGYARSAWYGADLLVPRDAVAKVLTTADVSPTGLWSFEALRVAARVPRLGLDTDHRTLPAEVGWTADAVHLDKGCYRGQETVARVHHLGRPPRRLVLLHLDGMGTDHLPAPHAPVTTVDGREVGRTGTAAQHFELGPVALAVLRRAVPDDERLLVAGTAAAIDA